jgi:hypothetical protein
MHMQRE